MSDDEVEMSQGNLALTNDALKAALARLRTSCRHAFPVTSSIVPVYNRAKLQLHLVVNSCILYATYCSSSIYI